MGAPFFLIYREHNINYPLSYSNPRLYENLTQLQILILYDLFYYPLKELGYLLYVRLQT